ncbi:DUF5615 family PIN-like protein [Haladaptatus sp. F3-133]|jgi:hypothetical protein|uniref:DUF5615 family PIN-like protein n=1 Tax=Halorutilus salinus TaxID=2487751 RepID=A0A9Q4GGR0_9EURY|nr:DUF5615 family PIN-like protein [Halorutilus salinus]MCX2819409.1 DUF5615 family PIN-like protein [Halorutilus salinus]
MTYRVVCDENLEPQVVRYLGKQGHEAVYVPDVLEKGVSDAEIARYARGNSYAVLTNDTDFLDDDRFPELKVLYYGSLQDSAYEIAEAVDEAGEYFPEHESLPQVLWLD